MNYICLKSLAHVACIATLFQSAVFAAENPVPNAIKFENDAVSFKTVPPHPEFNAKQAHYFRLDRKDDGSLVSDQSLPVLFIQAGGEISVSDKNIVETPWSSRSFESKGRVQLVHYLAANPGAAQQNKQFTDALIERQFSSEKLDRTVIVHMADMISFAKGFVVSRLAKNKVKYGEVNFVVDNEGVGLQRWGMKRKSYAIFVLDENGKVLFAKDGPLSEIEIKSTLKLIEKHTT